MGEMILILWMVSYGCPGGGGWDPVHYCTINIPPITVSAKTCDSTGRKFLADYRKKFTKRYWWTSPIDVTQMRAGYICAPISDKK